MSFYSQFLQFFIDHNAAQCIAYPVLPAVYNYSDQSSFQHVSSWYRKLRMKIWYPTRIKQVPEVGGTTVMATTVSRRPKKNDDNKP